MNLNALKLCLQMGVTHVVSTPSLEGIGADQYAAAMQKHKDAWAEAGFKVAVYETMTPVPADNIRRGSPGRDQELRNWIAFVEAMGKVGIPSCATTWVREEGERANKVVLRGGAVTTEHDYEASQKLPAAKESILRTGCGKP